MITPNTITNLTESAPALTIEEELVRANKECEKLYNIIDDLKQKLKDALKKVRVLARSKQRFLERKQRAQLKLAVKKEDEALLSENANNKVQNACSALTNLMRKYELRLNPAMCRAALLNIARNVEETTFAVIKASGLMQTRRSLSRKKELSCYDLAVTQRQISGRGDTIQQIGQYKYALANVYDRNLLRCFSTEMIFYDTGSVISIPPNFKILRAHFDGRFADCPKGYKQSVELKMVYGTETQRLSITVARALLLNAKEEDYYNFFYRAHKQSKCHKPPLLIIDFEMAVGKAAQRVFNQISIHGCWYHYWNSLLRMTGRLQRYTKEIANPSLFKLLTIMCFFYNPEICLSLALKYFVMENKIRFRDVNYKLIMYVYRTYIIRYRHMFFINLKLTTELTNNTCEGSNSAHSKAFTQCLTIRDYADFVENQTKRDTIRKAVSVMPMSNRLAALLSLQKYSKIHPEKLFKFLISIESLDSKTIEEINILVFAKITAKKRLPFTDVYGIHLANESQYYNDYRKLQKLKYRMNTSLEIAKVAEEIKLIEDKRPLDYLSETVDASEILLDENPYDSDPNNEECFIVSKRINEEMLEEIDSVYEDSSIIIDDNIAR